MTQQCRDSVFGASALTVPWRNLTIFFLDQCRVTQTNIFSFCFSLSPICRIHFVFFFILKYGDPQLGLNQQVKQVKLLRRASQGQCAEAHKPRRLWWHLVPRVLSYSFNNLHSAFFYLGYRALTFPFGEFSSDTFWKTGKHHCNSISWNKPDDINLGTSEHYKWTNTCVE